ncbi:MAG TPA: hypothetical protein VMH23_12180, partial [Bacteroidota bacterium]|nr:hypothetical protein [Bacteroidota bacterium]
MNTRSSKFFTLTAVAILSSLVTLAIVLNVSSAGARQQVVSGIINHVISKDQAVKLVQNFQNSPHVPTIKGGFFSRAIFDKLLAQPGCVGVRFYFAQKDDGSTTIVLAPTDSLLNDLQDGPFGD